MKNIKYEKIVKAVKQLCIDSCYELPADVLNAIKDAIKTNRNISNLLVFIVINVNYNSYQRQLEFPKYTLRMM